MTNLDNIRCEVYSLSYEPLSIVSGRRALMLSIKGKVMVLAEHPDCTVTSVSGVFAVPTKVALLRNLKMRPTTQTPARFSKRNVFTRDMWTCVYCKRHKTKLKSNEFLTLDHVIPRRRGGTDHWKNIVTSCNKCNNAKADFTLEECNFVLEKVPYAPTVFEIWSKSLNHRKN